MKNYVLKVLVILVCTMSLCGCSGVEGNQIKITNSEQFNETLMNYFLKKNTAELPAMVNFVSQNSYYTGNTKSPLYGFFAGIQHENPVAFAKLEKLNVTNDTHKMLKTAKEYENVAEDILKRDSYYLESPVSLDAFWGYFFATGDERVIKKLCATAKNSDDYIVKAAAEWSLKSNRKSYPDKIKECSVYQ